jgi:transposase InsO family protein|tara:strand:- start:13935 stop:14279 length:345 start_codon:yes stop_codon:yes gene_type:complete
MGHHLSLDMRDENVVKALKMALKNKQYVDNSVHRSDTGLQYCSAICQNDLKANGIQPSMIDGYDCYQNALVERIKGIPKQEFLIYRCKTVEKLKILVAELLKFTVKLGRTLVWT